MKIYDKIEPKRTVLLWILCIFTFIGAGCSALSDLFYMLFPNIMAQSSQLLESMPMFNNEEYKHAFDLMLSVKGWQYLLLFFSQAAIFTGAMIMLIKLNPNGFHVYTLGQVANFCVLTFAIGGEHRMAPASILWVVMMITLFATQLKFMQNDHHSNDNDDNDDSEEADDNDIEVEEP